MFDIIISYFENPYKNGRLEKWKDYLIFMSKSLKITHLSHHSVNLFLRITITYRYFLYSCLFFFKPMKVREDREQYLKQNKQIIHGTNLFPNRQLLLWTVRRDDYWQSSLSEISSWTGSRRKLKKKLQYLSRISLRYFDDIFAVFRTKKWSIKAFIFYIIYFLG